MDKIFDGKIKKIILEHDQMIDPIAEFARWNKCKLFIVDKITDKIKKDHQIAENIYLNLRYEIEQNEDDDTFIYYEKKTKENFIDVIIFLPWCFCGYGEIAKDMLIANYIDSRFKAGKW